MKRNVTLTITTVIMISLASCGDANKKQDTNMGTPAEIEAKKESSAEIGEASFSDEMTEKVFQNYQQIRMALVNSDAEEVNLAAGNLAESLTGEMEEMESMAMAMAVSDTLAGQPSDQPMTLADNSPRISPIQPPITLSVTASIKNC